MEALGDSWVSAAVDAANADGCVPVGPVSGVVEFTIGKKTNTTVALVDGCLTMANEDNDTVDVTLPFSTVEELSAYLAGEKSLAKAYIRGDFKPVGSTGVLIPMIELIDSGALSNLAAD